MEERSIKIAWKVYLVYGIYIALIGILALAFPKSLYLGQFASFTGGSFAQFAAENARIGSFIGLAFRAYGCMTLLVGIFKIFIALYPYRKGEAWSWWLILIIGVVAYSFLFSYSFVVRDLATFIFCTTAFVLFLIALLLPARAILSKKHTG